MQVEATALLKNIITANSKKDFEIGTLSDKAMEQAAEDKVFIGCGENEYTQDYRENKSLTNEKTKVDLLKENIDKINESVLKNNTDIFEEMGFAAEKEDVETLVTVSDRVKIQMARYNQNYQISGSKIDISVLEEITGSNAGAYQIAAKLEEAYNMAKDIGAIDKGGEEYLLKNNLEPTINNVYLATHSGAKSRESAEILSDEQWTNVKPQVQSMLENVGVKATSQRIENSKWIIENKIPLTTQNILNLEAIKNIDVNMSDSELINKMMNSIMSGINPKDTLITTGNDYLSRAVDAMDVIEKATAEEVQSIVNSGKQLTIANLENVKIPTQLNEIESVSAKRQLEEIRLLMSIEANVKMLKNGINIEIEPLKNLVSRLKSYEDEYHNTVFSSVEYSGNDEDIDLLKSTINAVEALKSVPSMIIGKLLYEDDQITVSQLKSKSDMVINRYEEMSTQVRSDLGDSYNKAFSSISTILEDLNIETNKANEKAVKILAYNNLDITGENVSKIKNSYEEFSRLMNNLKPKTAAYLIAEQINPLNTEISKLNAEIEAINLKIGATQEEKYSEFLWEMDKNKEFTKQERDAFIGTYRLMHLVEKGDFSAIGSLIKQGSDITLNNLATAVKSKKAQDMNFEIDENFGEISTLKIPEINLNSQLQYFSNLVKDIREKMTPESLKNVFEKVEAGSVSLETLAGEIEEAYEPLSNKNLFAQMKSVSDEAIQNLLDLNQKITPQNLILSGQIVGSKRGLFKYLDEEIHIKSYKIDEKIEDSQSMDKVYKELNEDIKKVISEKLDTDDSENIDINKLKLMGQSVDMLCSMGSKKHYQIPLRVNGEDCLLKLTVINDSEESGKVTIETQGENLGKISSEFRLEKTFLKGIILTDSMETVDWINNSLEEFIEKIKEIGIEKTDIRACLHQEIKDNMWKEKQAGTKVETKNLYRIAKIFIEQIVQKRGQI